MSIVRSCTHILFFSLSIAAIASVQIPADLSKYSIQRNCEIYNFSSELVEAFPGGFCAFKNDGTFLSVILDEGLRYYSKDNSILWKIPGHFHHQIKFSPSGNKILALASKIISSQGKKIRFDSFNIYNLQGKLLNKITFQEISEKFKIPPRIFPFRSEKKNLAGVTHEASHFNSFYEIPIIKDWQHANKINPGGYVVNSLSHGILFLSPDLKKVTYQLPYHRIGDNYPAHDVQITERGTLIIFINNAAKANNDLPFSVIREIDPITYKTIWEFKADPPQLFYSEWCGGVELINNKYIAFSGWTNGFYVFKKENKELVFYSFSITQRQGSQEIKLVNINDFFSMRK